MKKFIVNRAILILMTLMVSTHTLAGEKPFAMTELKDFDVYLFPLAGKHCRKGEEKRALFVQSNGKHKGKGSEGCWIGGGGSVSLRLVGHEHGRYDFIHIPNGNFISIRHRK